MSNNRHLINNADILRPQQLLDKGLPLPFLSGKYVVDEGWCAIITEGGAFREILHPGTHFLNKYHLFRDVKATAVSLRINNLTVITNREFTIARPVPVEINLELSVEYQVTDPRRVAMEINQPLTALFDRVIQAVRGAVVHATIDEIRTQGEGIARITLQNLQGMQLPKVIGISIFNVLVTTIKATDAGSDALAAQQMKEFNTVRDWQLDAMMTQQSRITPEWLLIHRPDIYQQLIAGNQALMKEMIDKGLLDPAGFLNQSTGANPVDPMQLMSGMGMPGFSQSSPFPQPGAGAPGAAPQIPASSPQKPVDSGDIRSRIREEMDFLRQLPGAVVETQAGTDDYGVPDGSYLIKVDLPRVSAGRLTLYFSCPDGYPRIPPEVDVDVDNQPSPYQFAALRRWRGEYLVELAREAKQHFG